MNTKVNDDHEAMVTDGHDPVVTQSDEGVAGAIDQEGVMGCTSNESGERT